MQLQSEFVADVHDLVKEKMNKQCEASPVTKKQNEQVFIDALQVVTGFGFLAFFRQLFRPFTSVASFWHQRSCMWREHAGPTSRECNSRNFSCRSSACGFNSAHANCNYSKPFVVTILIKLAVEQRKGRCALLRGDFSACIVLAPRPSRLQAVSELC
jgi:hypothetical protein